MSDDLERQTILEMEIDKLEDKLRIKEVYITDAKSKIAEINQEFFGSSSNKLSDLRANLEKALGVVNAMADVSKRHFNGEISGNEAAAKIQELRKDLTR